MKEIDEKTKLKKIDSFYSYYYSQEKRSIENAIDTLKNAKRIDLQDKYKNCPKPPMA